VEIKIKRYNNTIKVTVFEHAISYFQPA